MFFSRFAIVFGFLVTLLVLVAVMVVLRAQRESVKLPDQAVSVVTTQAGEVHIPVELARTTAEKIQGLSDRPSLPPGAGMLFVWDQNISTGFSMRRMEFPLDIVFIKDADGVAEIIHIASDLPACPGRTSGCASVRPAESFRYVLEVNAGFAEANGIAVGDVVALSVR